MTQINITQFGAYAEVDGEIILVTQFGVYAELEKTELRVTALGAYAELVKTEIRATLLGAYAELEESGEAPIGPGTRVIYDGQDITVYVHQFQLEAAVNQFELTNLAVADHTQRKGIGLAKWRLALRGWYHHTWDGLMMADAVNHAPRKPVQVRVQDHTGVTVIYAWDKASIARVGIGAKIDAALGYDAELLLNGRPDRTVD